MDGRLKFDLVDSCLENEKRLNQKVRPVPFQGMEFKEEIVMEKINFDDSVNIHPNYMMADLTRAKDKNPAEVELIIGDHVSVVISNMVNGYNGISYREVFNIPSVIIALRSIFSKMKEIPYQTLIGVNQLIYDGICGLKDFSDKNELLDLYRGLATEINQPTIHAILGLNSRNHSNIPITHRYAMYMAMSLYSTSDLITGTRRLNFCMTNNADMFNEAVLMDVYQVLYSTLTPLVIGTLIIPSTDTESEAYNIATSLQVNAVLNILNGQSQPVIDRILNDYARHAMICHNYGLMIRASLRSLSPGDYPMIVNEVARLEHAGVYIP